MKAKNQKYLKDYEADMVTAVFHSYVRQIPTAILMDIDRIYTEETGKTLSTKWSCSNCILKLMERVGFLYFKDNPDTLDEDLREKFKEKYRIQ